MSRQMMTGRSWSPPEVGRIRVTGTSFGVRLDGNAWHVVALTEGEVELRTDDGD